jgi:gentisate 1,2-dioxygenase
MVAVVSDSDQKANMAPEGDDVAARLEEMYTDMTAHSLQGLWQMERKPPDVRPYLWQWETVRRVADASRDLVDVPYPGERRAVALVNPGIPGAIGSTHVIFTAIQLVKPGEIARAHRHTPNALRFMIDGEGVSTNVEGTTVPMYPGDLVLTPNWLWHEHRNEGDRDAVWMDGLDSPFVFAMAAAVYEPYADEFLKETSRLDDFLRPGAPQPEAHESPDGGAPLLVYRWTAVESVLHALAADDSASEFDGVTIDYGQGDWTMSTMSCRMSMLRPGERTKAHRHTYSSVYHVHEGKGATLIDSKRFAWSDHDSFIVPPWTWHEHLNDSEMECAYLFSINDLPVQQTFNLNREESLEENDGHQEETSVFDPENPD